jgi:hypothetical protein
MFRFFCAPEKIVSGDLNDTLQPGHAEKLRKDINKKQQKQLKKLLPVLVSFHLGSTKLVSFDLSGNRLGQFFDELDLPGIFVWGGSPLDIGFELANQGFGWFRPNIQNNKGLDNEATDPVR